MKKKTLIILLMIAVILVAVIAVLKMNDAGGGSATIRSMAGGTETFAPVLEETKKALDSLPVVPEQDQPAPKNYFADAAFLGNSVLTGLDYYDSENVLEGADFYAADSLTVFSCGEMVSSMAGSRYNKIYVGFGTNEMSYNKDDLREAFYKLIDRLKKMNPEALIYLISVTPVGEEKSLSSSKFNEKLTMEFNEMLKEIAAEKGTLYLDAHEVLVDSRGYLPAEVTSDGIHFSPSHYKKWFAYLQTHYVP